MLTDPSPATRRPRYRRLRILLASLGVVLGLHAALLGGVGFEPGTDGGSVPPVVLDVRMLAPPAAIEPAPVPVAALPRPSAPARKRMPPQAPAAPVATVAPVAPDDAPVDAQPGPADVLVAVAPVDADIVKTVAGPSAAEPAINVPVYRTRLPPPATLHYDMRRGFFSGSGELAWKPAGDHYQLQLQGRVAGLEVLTELSTGAFDAHGIAPLRYTDTRLRRGTSAANFQRDKGKLTYSGPQVEFPLVPGAQDRVSWMLQIAAVLEADPQLAMPGGRIVFFVSGAHGDADVWAFRFAGVETVRSESGPLHAVKFTREPRRPYDRLVEIWLAPQRHHLPVRARFTADSDKDAFELLLRDMQSP